MSGMQHLSAVSCATRKNAAPLPKHGNQGRETAANRRRFPGTRNATVFIQ